MPGLLPRKRSYGHQVLTLWPVSEEAFHFQLFTCIHGHVNLLADLGQGDANIPGELRNRGCPLRPDGDIVLLIPRRHVLVRHLNLPAQEAGALSKMMPYEAFTASPWPKDETLFSYEVLEQTSGGGSLVTLYLVRVDWVEKCLARLKEKDVHPTRIEVSTRGLDRLLSTMTPLEDSTSLLLSVGGETEYFRRSRTGAPFSRAASAQEETPRETLERALEIDGRTGAGSGLDTSLIVAGARLPEYREGPVALPERIVPLESVKFTATNGLSPLSPELVMGAGAALLAVDPTATANLLPPSYLRWLEPRRLMRRVRVVAVLLVWCVAMLSGLVYVQYETQRARAENARSRIEALGADTRELESKSEALALLARERARVRRPLEIVLELYERTPQRIAINSMRLEPELSLVLGCEAPDFPDAFAYLDLLKESPLLSNVELITSSRPRASRDGLVEFKVKCEPKPARGGGSR